jgi:hypothetical protein
MITRILRSLTGPGLDDPDPERRIEALDRQEPPLEANALAEFARTDPEPSVREAAIARIDEAPALLELMDHAETEAAARDRLEARITADLDVTALLADLDDLAALRHLLDATPVDHAAAVLERIDDEDVLADVAGHHRLSPIRAAAAARVVEEEALRRVARAAQGRDKDVARSVRERLDALRDARSTGEEVAARLGQLAAEAAPLARVEEEPHAAERLALLQRHRDEALARLDETAPVFERFRQPALPRPEALAALNADLDRVGARLRAKQEAAENLEREAQSARERDAQLLALADGLERLLDQVTARISEGSAVSTERGPLVSALDVEDARWRDALGDGDAKGDAVARRDATRARLDALVRAFDGWLGAGEPPAPEPVTEIGDRIPRNRAEGEELWALRPPLNARLETLDAWLARSAWPEDCAAPEPLQRVREEHGTVAAAIAALDDAERRLGERIGKLAGRMERALDARKLKPVLGMQRDLAKQLEALPAVGERLVQRMEAIASRIDELRDWEYFATAPKREALCEAVEKLAAEEALPAPERADAVKALRTEWNGLGPVRGDEGTALAARFDAAAEQAFAPARAHFEAEAARRAENTTQRRRICEELEQFLDGYDWDAADWKSVERIHRSARDEWQRFEDVDRDGRALGKRYHRLARTLKRQLEQRWQANVARKEALVEAARALVVDGEPVPDSARQAKALQQEWKDVDITPRSVDRKLWKDFRAACDAVFTGIGAARDKVRAAQAARLEPLEAATKAYGEALEALRAKGLDALTTEDFTALPDQALREAVDAVERAETPPPQRRAVGDATRAARELVSEARRLRQALKANAKRARLRIALDHDVLRTEAEIGGTEAPALPADLPDAWVAALGRRDGDDAARRGACIDLELALGRESPPEDAALRLQRQVDLLNSGMRGDSAARDDAARVEAAVSVLLGCGGSGDDSLALARRARAALDG